MGSKSYSAAIKVIKILGQQGFAARLAGGCVRDRLMRVTPKDHDVATEALPQEVLALFQTKKGFKAIPTGIEHGTITIIHERCQIEVTTLRRDVRTDGRHAVVEFLGATFEQDAERRDFTINAMYEDAQGKIYDYFGGRTDLKKKILRFVGDPAKRIEEDYLRILRLYRFWARYGFRVDADSLQQAVALKEGLKNLSQERLTSELMQIFTAKHVAPALGHLMDSGIWSDLLPEVPLSKVPKAELESARQQKAEPIFFWGLLLIASGALTSYSAVLQLARRLRMSGGDGEKLARLVSGFWQLPHLEHEIAAAFTFLEKVTAHQAKDFCPEAIRFWQLALSLLKAKEKKKTQATLRYLLTCEKKYGSRRRKKLPIDGHWLQKELQVPPGPELGKILAQLQQAFWRGQWRTPAQAIKLFKEAFQKA